MKSAVVQRPHRCPAAPAIADAPAGVPLRAGALPTPHHLGGDPEEPQRGGRSLHGAHRQPGQLSDALVGWPAVASGSVVGERGAGLSHGDNGFEAHWVVGHYGSHVGVVAQAVSRRNGFVCPAPRSTGPAGNRRPSNVDVESNAGKAIEAVSAGATDPYRCGVGGAPAPQQRARTVIGASDDIGKVTVRGIWTVWNACATVECVFQDDSLQQGGVA